MNTAPIANLRGDYAEMAPDWTVPLHADPVFADYLQAYGQRGVEAGPENIHRLARLYWYTVEFGLIRTPRGLNAYGAGILSSAAELKHAIEGENVMHLPFEPVRV